MPEKRTTRDAGRDVEKGKAAGTPAGTPAGAPNRWSKHVMETSNALDLEPGVFKKESPREIAESLRRSAERSERRKASPFASAMSMLNFYLNRAGRNLPDSEKEKLNAAKDELRDLYHRPRRG